MTIPSLSFWATQHCRSFTWRSPVGLGLAWGVWFASPGFGNEWGKIPKYCHPDAATPIAPLVEECDRPQPPVSLAETFPYWQSPSALIAQREEASATEHQTTRPEFAKQIDPPSIEPPIEIDPTIIESSPVLQRWLEEVPDVALDIQHDPAFRTRVRLGYVEFPSTDHTGGIYAGVQDIFVGRTPLTFSAEYAANGRGDRAVIGADAQYYLLPLGWYGNIAPVLGYRSIETENLNTEGVNVGFRVIIAPSRTGAADFSLTQSWVSPGSEEEVGLTTFAAGYAIADDFRIGTDIQLQNSREGQDSRVGLLMEWML